MRQVYADAMRYWWLVGIAVTFGWLVVLSLYVVAGKPVGQVPIVGGNEVRLVPTTGEQGYPVQEFCEDGATRVTVALLPPDSTFSASYTLDRTKGGVHETVTVNAYADPSKQPVGTHYDSANNPSDAFVSKDAMKCIVGKAR